MTLVPRRFLYDARFALRMLRWQPMFTAAALLSLTLGITASIIIFTFVKALLMPALPVKDPAGLVLVYSTTQDQARGLIQYQSTSYPNAEDARCRYGGRPGWIR